MKKKQFMSKLAALTMAAAMGITALPATAVFAQTVNVEQSNGAITDATNQVKISVAESVAGTLTDTIKTSIQTATNTVNAKFFVNSGSEYDTYFDGTGKFAANKTAADVAKAVANDTSWNTLGTVDNVKVTDEDNWSFDVTLTTGEKFSVTVATSVAYALTDDVKNILDTYFTNKLYETYDSKTFTNQKVAYDLNNGSDAAAQAAKTALTTAGVTVEGDTSLVTNGKGTLTLKLSSSTPTTSYTVDGKKKDETGFTQIASGKTATIKYEYELNILNHDGTEDEAFNKALEAVNGIEIADPGSEPNVVKKIQDELVANGASATSAAAVTAGNHYKKATKDADGSWYWTKDTTVLKVTLKYSSASKLTDTDKAIKKFLVGSTKGGATAAWTDSDDKETDYSNVYTFNKDTAFSRGLQDSKATTAVSAADVEKAVEDGVNAKLKADGVDTNGVAVTTALAKNGAAATDVNTLATVAAPGSYYVIVKASIRNDFNGSTAGYIPTTNADTTSKTKSITYLVNVTTGQLKEVETTAISIDDADLDLVPNYGTNKGTQTAMLVVVKPNVTPENGNTGINYEVKDVKTGKPAQVVTSNDASDFAGYVDKDGKKASVNAGELGILVSQPGRYEVTATVDGTDLKDTAIITVKDNFSDVTNTNAYYYKATRWAKLHGISNGVGNDQFGVSKTVSRAEFVTWLYKLAQKSNSVVDIKGDVSTLKFTDVSKDAYYAEAVAWATQNGIVTGTSDTTFSPNKAVTRAQAAAFIYRFDGSDYGVTFGNNDQDKAVNFTDIVKGSYYETAALWAARHNVVNGLTTTAFAPEKTATREQAITMIYRYAGNNE